MTGWARKTLFKGGRHPNNFKKIMKRFTSVHNHSDFQSAGKRFEHHRKRLIFSLVSDTRQRTKTCLVVPKRIYNVKVTTSMFRVAK